MDVDFIDWEMLTDLDDSGRVNLSDSVQNMSGLEDIERDSEGIIRSDYFSLDSQIKYAIARPPVPETDDIGSVESDNPSWIDPASEKNRYSRNESGESWSDSSCDRSDIDRRFAESEELSVLENAKTQAGTGAENENSVQFWSDSGGHESIPIKYGDLVGKSEMAIVDTERTLDDLEFSVEDAVVDGPEEASHLVEIEKPATEAMKPESDEGNRGVLWWKLPFDFVKYCIYRSSPVWTLSVVAAMMGFVILGRRLYKMKRNGRSLQLKVAVDDKKVSQVMSRAARLNEAFSVVKRVPMIRPSLPAAGVAPWPMMSLR